MREWIAQYRKLAQVTQRQRESVGKQVARVHTAGAGGHHVQPGAGAGVPVIQGEGVFNDAGDLIYQEHGGYQTLYAVPAGGSETRIPYPSGWTQQSPKLKPRAPAATP